MNADPGLYGPSSVTWRVHGDPIMWIAGLRALYLQALHPLAMRGVSQNSDFAGDPWGRLIRTADYVGVVTFGTHEQVERAAARVRRIHAALRGVDPETGRSYRVDEPELLRWVHCCEVDSFLTTMRRAGLRLSDDEADRYVVEQRAAAEIVGLDPGLAPSSAAELRDYFTQVRPQLRATPEAWQAVRFVLLPPMPTWVVVATPARPAWAAVAGLAFAMLPRWARRLYRMPGLPTTDLAATLYARALRQALLTLPAAVRDGPRLKEARSRVSGPSAARHLRAL